MCMADMARLSAEWGAGAWPHPVIEAMAWLPKLSTGVQVFWGMMWKRQGDAHLISDGCEASQACKLGEIDTDGKCAGGRNHHHHRRRVAVAHHPRAPGDGPVHAGANHKEEACHWPSGEEQHLVGRDVEGPLLMTAQELLTACCNDGQDSHVEACPVHCDI